MIGTIVNRLQDQIKETPNEVWVTGDYHFNHDNILGFSNFGQKRGDHYPSIKEMNEDLIALHNSFVGKEDAVIHLGDVTLGVEGLKFLTRMNGVFYLINTDHHHDRRWLFPYLRGYIAPNIFSLPPVFLLEVAEREYVTFSHFPLREWSASYHGSFNLHGHRHGNDYVERENKPFFKEQNQFDCGVDVAFKLLGSFRPFRFTEAIEYAEMTEQELKDLIKENEDEEA